MLGRHVVLELGTVFWTRSFIILPTCLPHYRTFRILTEVLSITSYVSTVMSCFFLWILYYFLTLNAEQAWAIPHFHLHGRWGPQGRMLIMRRWLQNRLRVGWAVSAMVSFILTFNRLYKF